MNQKYVFKIIFYFIVNVMIYRKISEMEIAQSAGVVEYTDCDSAEG